MMRYLLCAALLLVGAAPVWAQHAQDNVQTAIYRNVSGAALTSGDAVVFDLTDANTTTGAFRTADSTIGLDVDTTTTADDRLFAGVLLDNTCADDQTCRFVISGPALVRWAGSTDDTDTVGAQVGTTTVAGQLGSGSGAGILLSLEVQGTAEGLDNALAWVYINVNPDQ